MRTWWYDSPVSMIWPRTDDAARDPTPSEMIESLRLNVVDDLNRISSKSSRRQLLQVFEFCVAARNAGRSDDVIHDIAGLLRTVKTGRLSDREIRPLFTDMRRRLDLSPLDRPTAVYVLRGALPMALVLAAIAIAIGIYHETLLAMIGHPPTVLGVPTDALAFIVAGSAAGVMMRLFIAVNGGREFSPPHPSLLVMAGALRPVFGLVVGMAFAVLYANFGTILAGAIKVFAEIALALAADDVADIYTRLYGVAARIDDLWRLHFTAPPLFFVVTAFLTARSRLAHQVVERVALAAARIRRN